MQDLVKAFALVLLAELGDKTQLAALALSARYGKLKAFASCILALSAATVLCASLGSVISACVPGDLIKYASGIAFMLAGLFFLLMEERKREEEEREERSGAAVMLSAFLLVFLSEMGDKTQLAVLALALESGSIAYTLAGALAAFALADGAAVVLGERLSRALPGRLVSLASSAVFLIAGILTIADVW